VAEATLYLYCAWFGVKVWRIGKGFGVVQVW
jgi:hypothetical protein